MNLNTIWSTLTESLEPLGDSAAESTAAELGLEPGWQTLIWAIALFDNEPFSTKSFMRIRPYGSKQVNEARFISAAKQGNLMLVSDNEYVSTEKGKYVMSRLLQAMEDSIAPLQPVPAADLQKILDYVKRLLDATLVMPEPPSKFAMNRYYKNIHPGQDAQPLRLLVHYIGSLDQYRGAAHIASWESHNIKGYEWSAFTSIWRKEADTLDALYEEMGASVFTREEILEALQDLLARGWIAETAGNYQVTSEGANVRQEAEDMTDRLFFVPWSCLNESELEELSHLAEQLRDGLKNLEV